MLRDNKKKKILKYQLPILFYYLHIKFPDKNFISHLPFFIKYQIPKSDYLINYFFLHFVTALKNFCFRLHCWKCRNSCHTTSIYYCLWNTHFYGSVCLCCFNQWCCWRRWSILYPFFYIIYIIVQTRTQKYIFNYI